MFTPAAPAVWLPSFVGAVVAGGVVKLIPAADGAGGVVGVVPVGATLGSGDVPGNGGAVGIAGITLPPGENASGPADALLAANQRSYRSDQAPDGESIVACGPLRFPGGVGGIGEAGVSLRGGGSCDFVWGVVLSWVNVDSGGVGFVTGGIAANFSDCGCAFADGSGDSGFPVAISFTAATPATRLHTAATPTTNFRLVSFGPGFAGGAGAGVAGFVASGFTSVFTTGFGSGFTSGFGAGTDFGPVVAGGFTGTSTAIGSIRGSPAG